MATVVKKFGGTSVGDVQRIKNVAALVKDFLDKQPGTRLVVVASAMAGETNRLIALAKSCVPSPDPRELDALLATGEETSIALLAMALIEQGVPAVSLTAEQVGISTDTRHNNAQITEIKSQRLEQVLSKGKVAVVAGFQGVDGDGNVTTLGRGGSDITAVAIAAELKADACYIYTDVEGVFSTDPRICPRAQYLKEVSHEEMLEMASLGAKVLHPRSVYFAMRYEVPLVVLSTFNPGPGTWIIKEEKLMEKPLVTGITYRMDEAKITVNKVPGGSKPLDLIFGRLAEHGILVDMITQSGVSKDSYDLSFTVPDEVSGQALEIAQQCVPELEAEGAHLERDIAKISVVGVGMRYHTGVAAKMFSVLAEENIDVQMIGTSEIKISVAVPRKYGEVAVRALHEKFIEMRPEVSVEK
ncbi:MAG: aspartate kinase [Deltaproteobacteria bacterium]|nr:aspartate kinase [Deltaproteobacteria bacterium]